MKSFKNKNFILFFLLIILFLIYLFLIFSDFKEALSNISYSFGYLDNQHHWRLLDDFVNLKMPFRDYFIAPSHGWFYLLIQSPIYLLFKKNFLSELIIRHLYLPILGVILSYFIAKNILRKNYLVLIFLFFCLLFKTNWAFESSRHLFSELSLSFFLVWFLNNQKEIYLIISGLIAGFACLISFEYGIALNIAVFLTFLISFLAKTNFKKNFFKKFLLAEVIVLFPYFFWLFLNGVLKDFLDYTYGWINNFYYASPAAGDSFPRFSQINELLLISKLLIFGIPVEFLQRCNFYIVFFFYFIIFLIIILDFIKKRRIKNIDLFKIVLVIYGLLIFIRTTDTPAVGYFSYGLIPFFLLLTLNIEKIFFLIKKEKRIFLKIFYIFSLTMIFFWFILTENTGYILKIKEKKKTEVFEKEFYQPVGWFMRKDLVKDYKEVTKYVIENTDKKDFLYVYPWGPYNQLTKRSSPNSIPTSINFLAGESFLQKTKEELEIKKPKLVVINVYNNLSVAVYGKARGDVSRYFSLSNEEGPVFAGEGNIIEKFILENYETVFANKVAIVMKQREKPITVKLGREKVFTWEPSKEEKIETKLMIAKDKTNYKIKGKNASWKLILDKPIKAMDVEIEFKIDGDFLTRRLSRYFIKIYALGENEELLGETKILARKIWQKEKIYLSKPELIKSIKIEIGENTGLIWWLHPYNLAIKEVVFYE